MEVNPKSYSFDRSVLVTFAVASLIGLVISGYKFMSHKDCSAVDFIINSEEQTAGNLISFQAAFPGSGTGIWDFGDGSPSEEGSNVIHSYKLPGEYWVVLEVNGSCTVRKKVGISKKVRVIDPGTYPSFTAPVSAVVGERIQFTDHTPNAKSWKWSFGETMEIDAAGKSPKYAFKTSGTKTVRLIVNGRDTLAATKRITVFPKPVEKPRFNIAPREQVEVIKPPKEVVTVTEVPLPAPLKPVLEEKPKPEINRVQLEDYLLDIAENKRKPESLDPFCCEGLQTNLRANGKSQTLEGLIKKITDKSIVIEKLDIIKNKQTSCIDFIKIDYKIKKEGLFGIFN